VLDFARPVAPSARDVADAARELGISVGARERREIATLLAAVLDTALAQRLAAIRPSALRREHPFAFVLAAAATDVSTGPAPEWSAPGQAAPARPSAGGSQIERLATGVLDLLAREPGGGWLIVDYKSDRVGPHEDLAALVEREYGVQRLLYALAALHGGAREVEVVHWFLERPHEWVAARFAADDRERLAEWLQARVRDAETRGFTVSEAPHRGLCLTCPGLAGLCSWDEAETLRERPTGR
jgi:ATP-dependent helicase/nuclease subunit A